MTEQQLKWLEQIKKRMGEYQNAIKYTMQISKNKKATKELLARAESLKALSQQLTLGNDLRMEDV